MKPFSRIYFIIIFLISIFCLKNIFDFQLERKEMSTPSHVNNFRIPFIENQGQIHDDVKY